MGLPCCSPLRAQAMETESDSHPSSQRLLGDRWPDLLLPLCLIFVKRDGQAHVTGLL